MPLSTSARGRASGSPAISFGRDPQRGADQIADPDFLERHVEGDRKALVDAVVGAHAQHGVFAAQEVADAALADHDALGLAGRAGGVDDVGRGRASTGAALARRCRRRRRPSSASAVHTGRAQAVRRGANSSQLTTPAPRHRPGRPHALDRRVRIERQPGGAGLGDGRLHHQQIDAARQPQADDLPRPHAGFDQARGRPRRPARPARRSSVRARQRSARPGRACGGRSLRTGRRGFRSCSSSGATGPYRMSGAGEVAGAWDGDGSFIQGGWELDAAGAAASLHLTVIPADTRARGRAAFNVSAGSGP